MKCNSCGSDIPNNINTCPNCGATVESNIQNTSVIPITPTTPVLPADQNMETAPLEPAAPIETVVNSETQAIPVVDSNHVIESPTVNNDVPTTNDNIVSNPNPAEVTPVTNPAVVETPNPVVVPTNTVGAEVKPPLTPVENVMPTAPLNTATVMENNNILTQNTIAPSGEIESGTKIGSTTPKTEPTKKKPILLILIILIVLALIAGGGYYYYYSQYLTGAKRINAVVKGVTSFTSNLNNSKIEKTSGNYNVEGSLIAGSQNYDFKFKGAYATDVTAKKMDFSVDIEKLTADKDLVNKPLSFDFYLGDSKLYISLADFYDKLIYTEVENFDEYFDNINQNSIDYMTIVNSVINSLSKGLTAMSYKETVGNVNINGKSKKTNIITINCSKENQKRFVRGFVNGFNMNENALNEFAKIVDLKVEDIKKGLEDAAENYEGTDSNTVIYIYTAMFGQELDGIKIVNKDSEESVLEIFPDGNGYTMSYKEGSQNIFDFKVGINQKKNATTVENNYEFATTVYVEKVAYKADLKIDIIEDINPKHIDVNVKNSINKINLTEEDINLIKQNMAASGDIGLLLSESIFAPSLSTPDFGEGEYEFNTEIDTGLPVENTCSLDGNTAC